MKLLKWREVLNKTISLILGSDQYQNWAKKKREIYLKKINRELNPYHRLSFNLEDRIQKTLMWRAKRSKVLSKRRKKERMLRKKRGLCD